MKPSIGRIVYFLRGQQIKPSPAIVTYVHADDMINATVFKDCAQPETATSVTLVEDEGSARQVIGDSVYMIAAYWPPRI